MDRPKRRLVWSAPTQALPAPASLAGTAADELWRRTRLHRVATHTNPPLEFWAYVPPNLQPDASLVVGLHGCRQTAASLDRGAGWSRMAERLGFAVLLPEQSQASNPRRCFRWYEASQVRRGSGEAAAIAEAVERMVETHRLDPRRVYVAGLSAGAAMANSLLATYPDRFAGGSILAGLPHGAARSMAEAFEAMNRPRRLEPGLRGEAVRVASVHQGPWPRVTIWQGDADQTVHPANGQELLQQWLDVHGLHEDQPTVETRQHRLHRRTWFATDGTPVLEHNRILGMDHGVPIDPEGGATAVGEAGPWLIDVGICSTREALRFWGLSERAPAMTLATAMRQHEAAEREFAPGSLSNYNIADEAASGREALDAGDGGEHDATASPDRDRRHGDGPIARIRHWLGI